MIIRNEFKTRTIEFIKKESGKEQSTIIHLIRIVLETEDFKINADNNFWISEPDIRTFLNELESLDSSRKGQATLTSVYPGDMVTTFKPLDNQGHLSVVFQCKKDKPMYKDYSWDVKVEFEIDPTSLTTIKRQILELTE